MRPTCIALLVAFACGLSAQANTRQMAVELTATVQASPPQITLNWTDVAGTTQYQVYKRAWGSSTWSGVIATVSGATLTWTDTSVAAGNAYEYAVSRTQSTWTGWGLISASIDAPAVHDRGRLILVVDDSFATPLATKLTRLQDSLTGDGWQVTRIDVSRAATAASVRTLIQAAYNTSPSTTRGVFLFGHVPVPYSGDFGPDAHADHQGAWPADGYYGEMNGTWTDSTVNNTTASRAANHNVPGDGKFDQSSFTSALEMMVGRVDLANMPAFSQTEEQLLEAYLDKLHEFRTAQWRPNNQAVVRDNFGVFSGEGFAASGWRSFAPMVGPAAVTSLASGTFFSTLTADSYLWAYGCGGGSYTSAGGVGSTTDFVNNAVQVPFTSLFGSYHGDWDSNNNFMRAALCSGRGLTCAWSGRPWWYFHSMAIGETIGRSFLETVNDPALSSYGNSGVHIGLMGDPTLRLHYVAPATAVAANQAGGTVTVSWTASVDSVNGYYVYRATARGGPYTLLTASAVTGLSYDDATAPMGQVFYMVRAAATQSTPSGRYENLATGEIVEITVTGQPPVVTGQPASITVSEGQTATFTVTATGSGLSYQWRVNGGDISGANSDSYTTPVLALADSGNLYSCFVSNTHGDDTSADAVLTVTVGGGGPGGGGGGGGSGGGGGCTAAAPATGAAMLLLLAAVAFRRRRQTARP